MATVDARAIPQHAIRNDVKRTMVLILLFDAYELKSGSTRIDNPLFQERTATRVPTPTLGVGEHVSFPPRELLPKEGVAGVEP